MSPLTLLYVTLFALHLHLFGWCFQKIGALSMVPPDVVMQNEI